MLDTIIHTEDDKEFKGYIAQPANIDKAPALILMHEVYGVNDGLTDMADKLADKGFLVLCPNMYWQQDENASFQYQKSGEDLTPALDQQRGDAYKLMAHFTQNDTEDDITARNEEVITNINLAVKFLKNHDKCNGQVGVSGLCFGGRNTYLGLAERLNVDAGIALYPTPNLGDVFSHAAAMKIVSPLMFIVGGKDPYISDEEKDLMQAASGNVVTYTVNHPEPIHKINSKGNPDIMTLIYKSSGHAWTRKNGKEEDTRTAQHTIDAMAAFLHTAFMPPNAVRIIPSVITRQKPQSPTYGIRKG